MNTWTVLIQNFLLPVIITLIPVTAFCTAQQTEIIYYENNEESLMDFPLESNSSLNLYVTIKKIISLEFISWSSCLRGYVGTWKIENNKLYLIKISDCDHEKRFLNYNDKPKIADWFTGNLRIAKGNVLFYYYSGFDSIYEHYNTIQIDSGVVVNQVENSGSFIFLNRILNGYYKAKDNKEIHLYSKSAQLTVLLESLIMQACENSVQELDIDNVKKYIRFTITIDQQFNDIAPPEYRTQYGTSSQNLTLLCDIMGGQFELYQKNGNIIIHFKKVKEPSKEIIEYLKINNNKFYF